MTRIMAPEENYFAIDALSNSFLKAFSRSPAHAFTRIESPALAFGTMLHERVLEPDVFEKKYLVADIDKRTKAGKEAAAEAEAGGKVIVKTDDLKRIDAMRDAINSRLYYGEKIEEILSRSKKEIGIEFSLFGEGFKAKIDFFDPDTATIFDLKTTDDASMFWRSVRNFKYYWQAYIYANGMRQIVEQPVKFVFVVIEKSEPYGCKLYELDPEFLRHAEIELEKVMADYRTWREAGSDKTQGYRQSVETVNCWL